MDSDCKPRTVSIAGHGQLSIASHGLTRMYTDNRRRLATDAYVIICGQSSKNTQSVKIRVHPWQKKQAPIRGGSQPRTVSIASHGLTRMFTDNRKGPCHGFLDFKSVACFQRALHPCESVFIRGKKTVPYPWRPSATDSFQSQATD
jgi:hypothetical protein